MFRGSKLSLLVGQELKTWLVRNSGRGDLETNFEVHEGLRNAGMGMGWKRKRMRPNAEKLASI